MGELGGNIILIGNTPINQIERVVIHEMGHCYGLNHCESNHCVMSPKRNSDWLKLNFCDECLKKF